MNTNEDILMGMPTNIITQLRTAAVKSGLSMKALSEAADVRYASVFDFLKDKRDIRLETAAALAAALGLELRPLRTPHGKKVH